MRQDPVSRIQKDSLLQCYSPQLCLYKQFLSDAAFPAYIGEKLLVQAQLRGIALKKAVLLNTGDGILPHGSIPELLCSLGLDSESIADTAWNMVQAYE